MSVVHMHHARGFRMAARQVPFSFRPTYGISMPSNNRTTVLLMPWLRSKNLGAVRHMSTIGNVFGRILKLRYLVVTGAVGGGVTAHQVILVFFSL